MENIILAKLSDGIWEDKGANWISNTPEIINPYLGKNHPEFKATMLHCGETKDSIKAN